MPVDEHAHRQPHNYYADSRIARMIRLDILHAVGPYKSIPSANFGPHGDWLARIKSYVILRGRFSKTRASLNHIVYANCTATWRMYPLRVLRGGVCECLPRQVTWEVCGELPRPFTGVILALVANLIVLPSGKRHERFDRALLSLWLWLYHIEFKSNDPTFLLWSRCKCFLMWKQNSHNEDLNMHRTKCMDNK